MGGETDLLCEHMNYLLNDGPQLLRRIGAAVDRADGRAVEIAAHRLKSLLGTYNHHQARDLAQELELLGKNGRIERANELLERLEPLLDDFLAAVRSYLQRQGSLVAAGSANGSG